MMFRLPFFKRRKKPIVLLEKSFQGIIQGMASDFLKSDVFKNSSIKGGRREKPIQDFFKGNLPGKYKVTMGEVVDLFDNQSPQLDVMIYDGQRNFPFYYSEDGCIIPAEALLVCIEVKSMLNATEVERSLQSASKLYKLKPNRLDISSRRVGGEAADDKYRYFTCLFAYNSDLSEEDWLNKEYTRFFRLSERSKIPSSVINRIYVANRGLINVDDEMGITEEPETGSALMHFYMHIFNFLERENRRRTSAPYIDYAGRLTAGWQHLERI